MAKINSPKYHVSDPIIFQLNEEVEVWKNVNNGESGVTYQLDPMDEISFYLAGLQNLLKPSQTSEIRGLARPPNMMVHDYFDSVIKYPLETPWTAKV